jgi:crotonobetainyl-CoA:carnitine CoA-transferase CaiB-like acyl-CoA transferase
MGAPLHGQHNEEIFAEIGITPEQQAQLRAKGIIT